MLFHVSLVSWMLSGHLFLRLLSGSIDISMQDDMWIALIFHTSHVTEIHYKSRLFCITLAVSVSLFIISLMFIHIHTTVINSGRAHTTQHRTHCGLWLRLQSWLMPQSPHRLRNGLKCVEWDVKPCLKQSNPWCPQSIVFFSVLVACASM